MWNINKVEKMNGKIAIITVGNSGLGLETAKFLDSKGVEVIITVRNLEKGIKVIEQFKLKNTKAMLLNLASFDSIKNFTKEFKMKYVTWSSFFVTLLRLFYAVYLFSNGVSPFNEECGLLEL